MKNKTIFIILFTLLNLNYTYSQRFTNNQSFTNVTYNARSLEEMSKLPLMKQKIANDNYDKIISLRKELYTLREGIKINQDKYYPSIDGINSILYELLSGENDLADQEKTI